MNLERLNILDPSVRELTFFADKYHLQLTLERARERERERAREKEREREREKKYSIIQYKKYDSI